MNADGGGSWVAPRTGLPQATDLRHQERQRPAGVGTPALQNGQRPATREGALREACEEFEGLFVAMLFRAMRATVPREGLLSGGSAGEIFDSMWSEEVGRAAARSGPLGIGEMLLGALGGRGDGQGSRG